jgi:hypothetical protein
VDGAQQINVRRGMSAPKNRGSALQGKKIPQSAAKMSNFQDFRVKFHNLKINDSLRQWAASYSYHP